MSAAYINIVLLSSTTLLGSFHLTLIHHPKVIKESPSALVASQTSGLSSAPLWPFLLRFIAPIKQRVQEHHSSLGIPIHLSHIHINWQDLLYIIKINMHIYNNIAHLSDTIHFRKRRWHMERNILSLSYILIFHLLQVQQRYLWC